MLNPFLNKWVSPFYLSILHGNYATSILKDDERERFNASVVDALNRITPKVATKLIGGHWREAITGSWFAGLKGFTECRDQIGKRLIKSEACFAGQSHAFAMACFADQESAAFLERYLEEFLRRKDCYYDQGWAMPALMWIDEECGTNRTESFLAAGGLWESFTADKLDVNDAWTIESCKEDFWRSMTYCRQHFQQA
ncbi:DUF6000 family protein [Haloferula sp.]|uniref:DUF6000 family protein n=1 Tax=Haloferula sp. TaxID=2497595 RepID=UPI00329BE16D